MLVWSEVLMAICHTSCRESLHTRRSWVQSVQQEWVKGTEVMQLPPCVYTCFMLLQSFSQVLQHLS